MKKTYDEEKEQLNALVAELIGKLHEKNESANKVKLLMQAIKKYDAVTELTPQILADFSWQMSKHKQKVAVFQKR